jgi:hypothetical protein
VVLAGCGSTPQPAGILTDAWAAVSRGAVTNCFHDKGTKDTKDTKDTKENASRSAYPGRWLAADLVRRHKPGMGELRQAGRNTFVLGVPCVVNPLSPLDRANVSCPR